MVIINSKEKEIKVKGKIWMKNGKIVGSVVSGVVLSGIMAYTIKRVKLRGKLESQRARYRNDKVFRCVKEARYYDRIVQMFRGDKVRADMWVAVNYDYPYNYIDIYEDIVNGSKIIE